MDEIRDRFARNGLVRSRDERVLGRRRRRVGRRLGLDPGPPGCSSCSC